MPDLQLMWKTLHHIEQHPDTWNQEQFRCETGMCFAGWAATLDGAVWMSDDEQHFDGYYRVYPPNAEPDDRAVPVWEYAADALGLTEFQANVLFAANNSLTRLRQLVDRFERAPNEEEEVCAPVA